MLFDPKHLGVALAGLMPAACTRLNVGTAPEDASFDADPCGNACTLGRTCQSGRCTAAVCQHGRSNCDGREDNGCETPSANDPRNCGGCGAVCELPNASATCAASACRVGRCDDAHGDCDGIVSNGCEHELAADVAHCGACDVACVAPHATPSCVAGACAVSACSAGFADCDGDVANGCEVDLASSVAHCGACGNACPAPVNGSATCATGACGFACGAGFDRGTGACLPPGAPRLIAPLSASAVTSQRPTLRWTLGAGTDGAQLELCRDRAMSTGCQTHAATGTTFRVPTALAQGAWFWRALGRERGATLTATSLTWSFVVGPCDALVDRWRAAPLDLDGDGFTDLAVGARLADVGRIEDAGAVSVFPGSPTGGGETPSRVLVGAVTNDGFGNSVACAGDVNGDGYADLVVGAPAPFNGSTVLRPGAVSVFHGGATGVGATATYVLQGMSVGFASAVANAGDVNGDGYSDVAVGALFEAFGGRDTAGATRVFWGGATGLSEHPAHVFGGASPGDDAGVTSGAFDLNRDGFADLLVGAPGADPGGRADAGTVSVFLGSATGLGATPARVFEGDAPGDQMGASVAGVGDVNGDGFDDLAVGAPGASPGGRLRAGSVRVYAGREAGLELAVARVYEGAMPGDQMGVSVAGLGDVNGDGFDDLAIGAPGAAPGGRANAGRVSVFLGEAMGPGAAPVRVYDGLAPNSGYGASMAGVGDLNGDGYAELAVGDPGAPVRMTELVGRVNVYFGSAAGPGVMPAQVFEGNARHDLFGFSVARITSARRSPRRRS